MSFPVSFSINADPSLIATVTGVGDGSVENGLLVKSTPFHSDGTVDVNLGTAAQSVSSFRFTLEGDTADFIVVIAPDLSYTALPTSDDELALVGPAPADATVLDRFFAGITDINVSAALVGALEAWIVANATAIPVLVILGLVTEGYGFVLAGAGQLADLIEQFVEQILAQEVTAGDLTNDEAKQVKTWAKAGDGLLQLPSILTTDDTLARVLAGIAADVNFESESVNAKLGVTMTSNIAGKWVLALSALKK